MEGHISYHKYLLSDDMPIKFKNTPDLKCIAKATTCSTYQLIATAKRKAEAFFPPFHRDLFFDYFRFRIQIQYSGSFILCFILSLKVRILIWHALKFVRSHTFQNRSIVVSPELEPLIVKLPVIYLKSLSR